MRRPAILLLSLCVLMLAGGCSGGEGSTVTPRRRAYPRLELSADTTGCPARLGDVELRVNRVASFRPDSLRPGWADIEYPATTGATLHLSLTRPESLPEAVANRRQRMALNLGDAPARAEEFHSGAWACTLVFSDRAGLTTPVQILATNADGRLLSGAVALKAPGADADSIRPLLELLRTDARTLLLSLR